MGKDLYEEYEEVRKVYEAVHKITGIDIGKLSFEGPEEVLNETKNTQLAILSYLRSVKEKWNKCRIFGRAKSWRIYSAY